MIHYSWMWRIPAVLLGSLLLGWASAWAADGVVAETLDNGLRVLLLEDHRSPIVSFQVWYRVGSRNEARGATGIAHFLEHMMFKGTPTHGRGQFVRLDRKIVVSGKTADIAGRRIIKTTRYP